MEKKKIISYIFLLIIVSILLFFIFTFLLKDNNEDYNYEHLIGNNFIANDGSYLMLNNDKTFYWYKDKENKEEYYYGTFEIIRGEHAIKYISNNLSLYGIDEEYQRHFLKDKNIDNYYYLNLKNEKLVSNDKTEQMSKETKYYGLASEDYKILELINMDANNYAIFTLDN